MGRQRCDIGLGSFHDLTLGEAREKAAELRKAAKAGLDPVAVRDQARRAVPSFRQAAQSCHKEMQKGWTEKHAKMFLASLETHVFPIIGHLRVDQVEAAQVRDAVSPIWQSKPDMARKVRVRIGMVLNFAHGEGWRAREAPVRAVSLLLSRQPAAAIFRPCPTRRCRRSSPPFGPSRRRSGGWRRERLSR